MPRPSSLRRRSSYAPQACVVGAVVLLLLSLSILHSRLSSSPLLSFPFRSSISNQSDRSNFNPLFDDAANDAFDDAADDRIDELDVIDDDKKQVTASTDEADSDSDDTDTGTGSGLFWDHIIGVARISFGRPESRSAREDDLPPEDQGRSKLAFGSDDEPVDEGVRAKLDSIRGIEDALLLNVGGHGGNSLMRDGWVGWLEGKSDFLRRDRMLRSNLELLNPKNHPLLQDPDVAGLTGLTRGDRLMQKEILKEMENSDTIGSKKKMVDGRRTLHLKVEEEKEKGEEERSWRWGNFPGIDSNLSFSGFIDQFLGIGQCSLRVFMVWNYPSWSFGVRHQRGLESLMHHHSNACIILFSETMELDFFKDFVKDGFRIAVVMPNLDELLKDTPALIFASVWGEWRMTKHYPLHYSELVRLAALYKYGGVYFDSDLIVLKPLYSLKNSICIEDQRDENSTFSGAVMAFEKHSPFLKECLTEFYSTYDDTLIMWNGADLIARVINRLQGRGDRSWEDLGITIIPPQLISPINSINITRYFAAASNDSENAYQENLFGRILNESFTFHFWDDITFALVPEPGSLAEKLINQYCLHCLDVL